MKRKRVQSGGKRKSTGRPNPYGRPYYQKSPYVMYKAVRPMLDQERVVDLKYTRIYTMNSAGAVFMQQLYQTNAYDVDASLGSTAMPGFAEWAGFYARFRPLKISYLFEISNNENFPVLALAMLSNDGGLTINNPEYLGNPLTKGKMMGPIGGACTATLKGGATTVTISGTRQPLFDDLYTGSTTSSTLASAGTNYLYLAGLTTGPVFVTGIGVRATVILKVQFYRPRSFVA